MDNDYLIHHGIKGQRWGVRRFQNEDGSLTEAGRRRYYREADKIAKRLSRDSKKASEIAIKYVKDFDEASRKVLEGKRAFSKAYAEEWRKVHDKLEKEYGHDDFTFTISPTKKVRDLYDKADEYDKIRGEIAKNFIAEFLEGTGVKDFGESSKLGGVYEYAGRDYLYYMFEDPDH